MDPATRLAEMRSDLLGEMVRISAIDPHTVGIGFGKRIGDGTTEAISRLTEIGVGSSLEHGLARTERALAKLADGTYGRCDGCGEPIAPARLGAMPDVVLCVACARSQPRPPPRRR